MTAFQHLAEDSLEAGRAALARGDWQRARELLEAGLAEHESPQAWEDLSWAIWWLGDTEAIFAARERAFRAHRQAGDLCGAARMAVWLANDSLDFRGDDAVAAGWLERARRLLDGQPPCSESGWLLIFEGYQMLRQDPDAEQAARCAREAARLGSELAVADLEALGFALEGEALVMGGRVEEGMRRLDEAAAVASGEDFELPVSPAFAQCILISVCEKLGDFARVAQWCDAMQSQGERLNSRHVIGVCRSAYGHVLAARGDWARAETELTDALGALEATRPGLAPAGLVRLAALRARQGRSDEAVALFERARPDPLALVGLGTLALEAGDGRTAADTAERILRRSGVGAPLERVPALELLVRSQVGLGDLGAAHTGLAELEEIVQRLGTPYLSGRARLVAGELAMARGDHDAARRALEDSADLFAESAAPYEAALARLALAQALARLDRPDAAAAEAQAASDAFATLGASHDVERAEALLRADGAAEGAALGELTPREREVLALVAQGLGDAEIAARLVVSPHTVHRHVANIRTKLRLPSRAAAVAYASRAGLL